MQNRWYFSAHLWKNNENIENEQRVNSSNRRSIQIWSSFWLEINFIKVRKRRVSKTWTYGMGRCVSCDAGWWGRKGIKICIPLEINSKRKHWAHSEINQKQTYRKRKWKSLTMSDRSWAGEQSYKRGHESSQFSSTFWKLVHILVIFILSIHII